MKKIMQLLAFVIISNVTLQIKPYQSASHLKENVSKTWFEINQAVTILEAEFKEIYVSRNNNLLQIEAKIKLYFANFKTTPKFTNIILDIGRTAKDHWVEYDNNRLPKILKFDILLRHKLDSLTMMFIKNWHFKILYEK